MRAQAHSSCFLRRYILYFPHELFAVSFSFGDALDRADSRFLGHQSRMAIAVGDPHTLGSRPDNSIGDTSQGAARDEGQRLRPKHKESTYLEVRVVPYVLSRVRFEQQVQNTTSISVASASTNYCEYQARTLLDWASFIWFQNKQ